MTYVFLKHDFRVQSATVGLSGDIFSAGFGPGNGHYFIYEQHFGHKIGVALL